MAAVAGWVALAAMAVTQVASSRAGHLEIFVTLIVALLAVASVSFTAIGPGWPRALSAAAAAFALGLAAEWAGTRTGFPFGAYRYTGLLRPAAGTVPLVVPLAWAAMGPPGYAVGTSIARSRAGRIAAGAVALTAWDLFLDPQMIRNGFWRWVHPGPYQGVPLSNFAGWLLVAAGLMAVFDVLLAGTPQPAAAGVRAQPSNPRQITGNHPGLLVTYTVMAVMETVGFAAIFHHGRAIALAGALGMGIPAGLAWARRTRNRTGGTQHP
ncbi:MAG TPA: carotenoid biosynthesis protein [Streptosporangiaceae bacterium]